MSNANAFSAAKNQGDQLLASEANSLNTGQQAALCRTGTTTLTGNTVIDTNGKTFYIDLSQAPTSGGIVVDSSDFSFTSNSSGSFSIAANRLKLTGTGVPVLGSRTENRHQRCAAMTHVSFPYALADRNYVCNAAYGYVIIPMSNSIDGATLTTVTAYVRGTATAGTWAAQPGAMPSLDVAKTDSNGTYSVLGTTVATWSSLGAFQAVHTIVVSGLTHSIDNTAPSSVNLTVTGPGGVNFLADRYELLGIKCGFTVTALTPGG